MRRVRNFKALVLLDQTFGRSLPRQAASNADEYRTRSYPAKVQVLSCQYGRAHELSTFRGEANSALMFRLRGHKRSRTEKGRAQSGRPRSREENAIQRTDRRNCVYDTSGREGSIASAALKQFVA